MKLELLNEVIVAKGVKKKTIANTLGVSYGTLANKMIGKTDFTVGEATKLVELLNIDQQVAQAIFFEK